MEAIRAPRGTKDIMPEESWKWAYVLKVCRDVADDFGYREVQLPIFEHTELFCRGIGDTTDVVEKEMYTFTDRGGRSITLRPELTASMVRAYLEHDLRNQTQPVKLWSAGPMFRYERPQKGRYRQFWQVDVEALGVAGSTGGSGGHRFIPGTLPQAWTFKPRSGPQLRGLSQVSAGASKGLDRLPYAPLGAAL